MVSLEISCGYHKEFMTNIVIDKGLIGKCEWVSKDVDRNIIRNRCSRAQKPQMKRIFSYVLKGDRAKFSKIKHQSAYV
jgi:hypothetical protein